MSDLTDEELEILEHAHQTGRRPIGMLERAASEIRRHRAALAVDEERVRSVVREAIMDKLGDLYCVIDGRHLTRAGIEAVADAIATRAAEQLASAAVRLSANDRQVLNELSGHMKLTATEQSLLDRLLATVRP